MPTAQCTVCSLQSAEPACEASSPWTKAWRWLHRWARSVKMHQPASFWCVHFVVCKLSFDQNSKSRHREISKYGNPSYGTLVLDILYVLGEVLLLCFMRKHWIANCFPAIWWGKKVLPKFQRVIGPLPLTITHNYCQIIRNPGNSILVFQLCHQENRTSL